MQHTIIYALRHDRGVRDDGVGMARHEHTFDREQISRQEYKDELIATISECPCPTRPALHQPINKRMVRLCLDKPVTRGIDSALPLISATIFSSPRTRAGRNSGRCSAKRAESDPGGSQEILPLSIGWRDARN
jgi:hypothetical protein